MTQFLKQKENKNFAIVFFFFLKYKPTVLFKYKSEYCQHWGMKMVPIRTIFGNFTITQDDKKISVSAIEIMKIYHLQDLKKYEEG